MLGVVASREASRGGFRAVAHPVGTSPRRRRCVGRSLFAGYLGALAPTASRPPTPCRPAGAPHPPSHPPHASLCPAACLLQEGGKKKFEPKPLTRINRKKKKGGQGLAGGKLPKVVPSTRCKLRQMKLERVLDFLLMEREFITNQEVLRPKEASERVDTTKLDALRDMPMQVGCLEELVDDNHAIISTPHGPDLYVCILSVVDPDLLAPNAAVLLHHKYHSIVGVLADDADPLVSVMKVEKAPLESYADIGGLDKQVQEIKEAVELPLTRPELYEDIGIKPPKGVVLYGEPGTGKTLLAKAVANSTSATFLRVTGSEMVQKYLGEGPKLVREIFKVADEHAPSIVFIDEIDAIGVKRVDASSSGEREVQRTMLELLNQLDGFDERGDVKVIMATNRIESLDPALIRPGRIDRKIEFPLPDVKTKRMIFRIHTSRMGMAEDVDLEGACQEGNSPGALP